MECFFFSTITDDEKKKKVLNLCCCMERPWRYIGMFVVIITKQINKKEWWSSLNGSFFSFEVVTNVFKNLKKSSVCLVWCHVNLLLKCYCSKRNNYYTLKPLEFFFENLKE